MFAPRSIAMLAALTLIVLTACAPIYRNHGYVPPPEDLALIEVGQTTVDSLPTLVGQPSAEGLLTGSAWYYVGSRWRHYGAYRPEEIDRRVVAVSFAPSGVVTNVETFGLERGRVVTLSRRVTEGSVTSISLIRQLLGNLGNFNPGQFID